MPAFNASKVSVSAMAISAWLRGHAVRSRQPEARNAPWAARNPGASQARSGRAQGSRRCAPIQGFRQGRTRGEPGAGRFVPRREALGIMAPQLAGFYGRVRVGEAVVIIVGLSSCGTRSVRRAAIINE